MNAWPSPESLTLTLPPGVQLRWFRDDELEALPALLERWYPAVRVGAESVLLDALFLRRHLASSVRDTSDLWACAIVLEGAVVGFQAFERNVASRTLHGRLGVLAPEARAGMLGALGFPLFEALGALMGAESLQVFVTLASKGQQLFAERRGFRLAGLVPGFDRDAQADGTVKRVMEALYVKSLVEVSWPDAGSLTPKTKAAFAVLFPEQISGG